MPNPVTHDFQIGDLVLCQCSSNCKTTGVVDAIGENDELHTSDPNSDNQTSWIPVRFAKLIKIADNDEIPL